MRLHRVGLTIAVWLGVVSIFVLQRIVGDLFREGPIRVASVGAEIVYWIPWLLLAPVLVWLARRYPFTPDRWRRSLAAHLVAGLAFAMVEAGASALAERSAILFWWPPAPARRMAPLAATWAVYTIVALWKYWAFLGIWNAFAAARRSRQRETQAAQLESQLTAARLQSLQHRLQPHFLFNALHSAAMLALVDPEAANRTLARLADLLRDSLRESSDANVSLACELRTIDRYLEIERIRFADRLRVDLEMEPGVLDARVPSLLLQPLVENAVHHGIASASTAGHLVIRGRRTGSDLVLEVDDDGPGLPEGFRLGTAPGLGLGTTAARLALLHPGSHQLSLVNRPGGGCRATVTLPFQAV